MHGRGRSFSGCQTCPGQRLRESVGPARCFQLATEGQYYVAEHTATQYVHIPAAAIVLQANFQGSQQTFSEVNNNCGCVKERLLEGLCIHMLKNMWSNGYVVWHRRCQVRCAVTE
jgi:hypothetical protein